MTDNDIQDLEYKNDKIRGDNDSVSTLGDASPMNQAQKRRERRQKRFLVQVLVFTAVALFSLATSLISSPYRHMYMENIKQENAVVQNKTQLIELRQHVVQKVALQIARDFPPVLPSIWCVDSRLRHEQERRKPMGLSYVRIPRAASSTLASINQRAAKNFGKRNGLKHSCMRHDGNTLGTYYRMRDQLSFLWTFVRAPNNRAMSQVGTGLRRQRGNNVNYTSNQIVNALKTNDNIKNGVISEGRGGFQLQFSMLNIIEDYSAFNKSNPEHVVNPEQVKQNVKHTIDKYDFIGVVERFHESLVALQLILGLETEDILYFAVHKSNQYLKQRRYCQAPLDWQQLITKPVNDYLESNTWFAQNYGDLVLHKAANLSLDRTINSLGHDRFTDALRKFQMLMEKAENTCVPVFPCSFNGTVHTVDDLDDCNVEQTACGYSCLDGLSATHD